VILVLAGASERVSGYNRTELDRKSFSQRMYQNVQPDARLLEKQ
jgi:hypothetical protein